MGNKRKSNNQDKKSKKAKYLGNHQNIDIGWSGIFVTCVRGHEKQCRNELLDLFDEYSDDTNLLEDDKANEQQITDKSQEKLNIEESIAQELLEMDQSKKSSLFVPIELDCECVLFFRTKPPIDPVELVKKICKDIKETKIKKTRYAQRLTPVSLTTTANLDNLKILAPKVLGSQFHAGEEQKPFKFAIRPTIRNHNKLDRDEIIRSVAEAVGHDYGHSVDLKNFDKMILVECFKNCLGMSVVEEFNDLEKFNIQQIYEKALKEESDK